MSAPVPNAPAANAQDTVSESSLSVMSDEDAIAPGQQSGENIAAEPQQMEVNTQHAEVDLGDLIPGCSSRWT